MSYTFNPFTGTFDALDPDTTLNPNDYYTITDLDAGQLDNRYYTETEIGVLLGDKVDVAGDTMTGDLTLEQNLYIAEDKKLFFTADSDFFLKFSNMHAGLLLGAVTGTNNTAIDFQNGGEIYWNTHEDGNGPWSPYLIASGADDLHLGTDSGSIRIEAGTYLDFKAGGSNFARMDLDDLTQLRMYHWQDKAGYVAMFEDRGLLSSIGEIDFDLYTGGATTGHQHRINP